MPDAALLRRYSESGSQDAFAAIVNECLPLVYGAALRRVGGDAHLAQDVAQMVFTAVARDAARLARHPDLTGWLFTTTRFLAAKALRTERRRQTREQAWLAQPADEPAEQMPPRLRLVLDDVLMELQQLDREMLLMRFYRGLRLAEIGAVLNSSENAVQKRIERALDRLKSKLSVRGITSTAGAIAVAMETNGAVSVPAGLAAAATTAGIACGGGGAAALAATAAAPASKLALALAAVAVIGGSIGLVLYQRENARLRDELATATIARNAALQRAAVAAARSAPVVGVVAPTPAVSAPTNPETRAAPANSIPEVMPQPPPARAVAPRVRGGSNELVPLKVEYPKPLFTGTPRPTGLRNLEPAGRRAVDVLVPKPTVLLSRHKHVTASDTLPVIGELGLVTDGDKTGTDGTVLELGPGLQWLQIDLGETALIHAVAVWHFHAQARVYHDVVVQLSDDREFKRGVKTIFNNDDDNSARLGRGSDRSYVETNRGRVIDARATEARYVRLYSNGNTSDELNHYCEVEVFGEPGP